MNSCMSITASFYQKINALVCSHKTWVGFRALQGIVPQSYSMLQSSKELDKEVSQLQDSTNGLCCSCAGIVSTGMIVQK